jgi:hypothetical protein
MRPVTLNDPLDSSLPLPNFAPTIHKYESCMHKSYLLLSVPHQNTFRKQGGGFDVDLLSDFFNYCTHLL